MTVTPSKWLLAALAAGALLAAVALGAGLWVRANAHRIGPLVGDAVQRATGRRLTLSGPVRPIFALRPGLAAEDLVMANAPWASRPDMARIGHLEVRLALLPLLQGRIVVHRLVLEDAELLLEVDAAGRSNWSPQAAEVGAGAPPPQAGSPAAQPDLRGLEARRLTIDFVDARTGGKRRRLELAALDLHGPGDGPTLDLRLEGLLDSRPLEVAGRIGRLAGLLDPEAPWPVDLEIALAGLDGTVAGRIQRVAAFQGVDLQVALRESAPGKLKALTGWEWLAGGEPMEARGRLEDAAPGVWRLTDLAVQRIPSDLAGWLEIHTAARPVRLEGRLTARHLDLRPFLDPAPAAKTAGPRLFSDAPIQLASLKGADLALGLEAGELRLPRLAADQAALSLNLAGGRLEAVFRRATVGQGRLTGRIVLAALAGPGAAVEVKLEGQGLDVDELLRDLGQPAAVSGDLDASLDVRGRGVSTAEIMASLDGRATFLMARGRLDSGALRLVGADLATALQRLLNPVRDTSGDTEINCFVCRLESRAGQVAVEALFWDTASMTVFGDGDLDLHTERLDLGLRPVPKRGIANFSLSLGELTQPFRLGGTLTQPTLVVDRTRTAITVGKAVGGTLLLGPVGAAAALLSTPRGEENPCLKALGEAGEETPAPPEEPGTARRTVESVREGAKDLGHSLKEMIGR